MPSSRLTPPVTHAARAQASRDGEAFARPSTIDPESHVAADASIVRVEWLESPESIAAIEGEWRDLESRVSARMAFGSFDYLYPWYCHMPASQGTPLVGVVRRAGVMIGLAPLAFRTATLGRVPVKRVDSAGHDGDVGEYLFPADEAASLGALFESLFERGGFDVAVLTGVTPGGWVHHAARGAASRSGRGMDVIRYRYATVDLRTGFDGYFEGLSAKLRGNLRRRLKRAEGMGGISLDRIHRPVDQATLSRYLDRIFQIYARSWKAKDGEALQDYHRRFYADVAERFNARGTLDLSILQVGGRDASFILGIRERDAYYDVTISYDEEFASVSPGTLLIQEVARRIASEGTRLLVSHGDREYKRYWASTWVPQKRVAIFSPGLKPALARFARFEYPRIAHRIRQLFGHGDPDEGSGQS